MIRLFFPSCANASFVVLIDRLDSFFTYTLLCYQTIRIFARACSGKNLLLMLSPDACQFAAGMYRIAPLSFLHLFSLFAYITPEKGRFGELLSKLPIKFGNKAKSAFLPYSCLDIIQLGMKKRTAVIYRRPFLVIPNCRVKPSAEPWKRKTPKSFRDFSVFLYLVGVSGFEPEASWTRMTRNASLTPCKGGTLALRGCLDYDFGLRGWITA